MTARALVTGVLRAYKLVISPLLPPACRFHPTCSEYAAEAVQLHGVVRGGVLAARRLVRCGPWTAGGFDPVPASVGRPDRAAASQHERA